MNHNYIFIPDINNVGRQIGNLRRKQKITITELSQKSGVTASFICKVEHGRCIARVDTLLAIFRSLGYTDIVFTT